jgi:hypothetical protein
MLAASWQTEHADCAAAAAAAAAVLLLLLLAGLDCSNFAAFAYNLAFGFYPTSSIGEIACHPTKPPGRLLTAVSTSTLDQLRPGDLVYVTVGSKGRSPPVRVSHVVFWTRWTVDFAGSGQLSKDALMANVPDYQKAGIEKCLAAKQAAGQPVYIIADRWGSQFGVVLCVACKHNPFTAMTCTACIRSCIRSFLATTAGPVRKFSASAAAATAATAGAVRSHYNGPGLRPFCGWYISSFSHARRIINPDSSLPMNDDSIAFWDESSGSCKSRWALQS